MSTPTSHRPGARNHRRRASGALPLLGIAAAIVALAGVAIWLAAIGAPESPSERQARLDDAETPVPLPVANSPQTVAGVRVEEPAVDRGKLPLNQTVTQSYELLNTGDDPVALGKTTIEVLDGCCPPEPIVTQSQLQPGQSATVSISMQMHPGMDGPHLFHLSVPVGNDSANALHLYFKGDFGG